MTHIIRDNDWWDRYFLGLAKYISEASKDPSTKVGAVIVNSKGVVVGTGYNGFPRGVYDLKERLDDRTEKYPRIVHAELNAILNSTTSLDGCTIYVYPTLMIPPACPSCAAAIIQAGIKKIIGWNNQNLEERWQDLAIISSSMFKEAGVTVKVVDKIEE